MVLLIAGRKDDLFTGISPAWPVWYWRDLHDSASGHPRSSGMMASANGEGAGQDPKLPNTLHTPI